MRSLISAVLNQDPELEVVGHAADANEARQAMKALDPDVVTLDIEMPHMNGLEFLEKIMRLRPTPVVMVSGLTGHGAAATISALEIGAFDYFHKPRHADMGAFGELAEKVKAAASARLRLISGRAARKAASSHSRSQSSADYEPDGKVVAIGSSTGGVEALIAVLSTFPANCPPTVITQHMPATFTKSFADRLNRLCAPQVAEASPDAVLRPGQIYLAPGGATHLAVVGSGTLRCRLLQGDLVNGHRPSVDVLFSSVAKSVGSNAVGVILTGMGRDGADGLLKMRTAGALTIGQDASTSLVYGMPKVAFEIGAVEKQVPLQRIGYDILNATAVHQEGGLRCHSRLQ
jgi:two-component system chemotaxis response regulator CheB